MLERQDQSRQPQLRLRRSDDRAREQEVSVNMRLLHFVAAAFLLSGLALLCSAAQARVVDTIRMKDGSTLKGYATAYDDATKILSFQTEDGRVLSLKLDQLNTLSVYQVTQSTIPKDNAKGQLQMGNFARDAGLYMHAVRHYGYAEKADPSLKPKIDEERVILRKLAAEFCMDNARKAIEKGDRKEAEKWLTTIVQKLPGEPQAAEATKILDELFTVERAKREETVVSKAPPDLLKTDLKQGKYYYDQMIKFAKQGLTSPGGSPQAINAWESSISNGGSALKEIDKVEKKYTDAPTRETLTGYTKLVNGQIIEVRLNLASLYTTRSSYNKALGEVNQALAIEPENAQALAARARIEEASSSGILTRW
jgi:tetratricopeptide (TPR) repeat protein